MPLDPSIALSVRNPRIEYDPINPINAMLQGEQLRGAREANALRQLQMQQSQREMEQEEVANRLLANAISPEGEIDYNRVIQGMAGAGQAGKIPALLAQREQAGLRQAQMQAAQATRQRAMLDQALSVLKGANEQNYPTLRSAIISQAPALGQFFPETYDKSSIDALVGRVEQQVKESADLANMKALGFEMTPEGYQRYMSSRFQPVKSDVLSPEAEAQKIRLAQAGRPPATPREPSPPSLTQIQDPTDPSRMITIDARRYQGGGMGSPGVIGTTGKTAPVAAAAAKRDEGVAQARDILDTLRTAYDTLDRERAVPSQARNILSNALSYVAGTRAGQVAGRIAGTEAQTERDIIQSARNQMLNAVKNATGMSAQQLNSNIEFRSWLESLSDPTKSIEANRAILDNLEKFIASGGTFSAKTEAVPSVRGRPTGDLTPQEQQELEQLRARFKK